MCFFFGFFWFLLLTSLLLFLLASFFFQLLFSFLYIFVVFPRLELHEKFNFWTNKKPIFVWILQLNDSPFLFQELNFAFVEF